MSFVKDMENDPILINNEKWYELTREEQYEIMLKKVRRYYDAYRDKYFTNYKFSYIPWWTIAFQGLVTHFKA